MKRSTKIGFASVTISLTFETQQELDTFTAIMARRKKVPEAVFHFGSPSKAVDSLLDRGITPIKVENVMSQAFVAALEAGGRP